MEQNIWLQELSTLEEKNKNILIAITTIALIIVFLLIFGKPILNQITTYRDKSQADAEAQCAQDDAPYWCDL